MPNDQDWLDQNYPKNGVCLRETNDAKRNIIGGKLYEEDKWNNLGKKRSEITKLDISKLDLEGELDLTDFTNLKDLDCDSNKLTALKLNNLSRLWSLSCINNLLTNLETEGLDSLALLYCFENYLTDINSLLLGLNPKKIVEIRISDNNFSDSDLWPFNKFIKVEALFIHNDDGRDRKNRFFGSLEPLKDLTELTHLNIANTDIDSGLEYLPDSLQTLNCSVTKPGVKVKTIEDFLVDEEVKILEEEIDGVPWKTEWKELPPERLKLVKLRAENCSLKTKVEKLENELEIEQDHAKNMDNFYRQQFPYNNSLEHVRNELSRQILELNYENKQLKKQNQELKNKLALIGGIILAVMIIVTFFLRRNKQKKSER